MTLKGVFRSPVSLNDYLSEKKVTLSDHLEIAINISEALRRIHAEKRVYNDLNPDSVRIDTRTKAVMLAPSPVSSSLSENIPKTAWAANENRYRKRQAAYMSPEQTGRTAHPVDFRSDYYALGVILYRFLTDKLPFDFKQPLQTLHAHIARKPVSVDKINPAIPQVLSHITSKLLAKNPDDRYQSAAGIRFDLENCLHQLRTANRIKRFPVATKDVSPIFDIPCVLYGRYKEIKLLLDACGMVQKNGSEVVLFSGPPGIGKSFLINEVQSHLIKDKGCFISGKFDQYEQTMPCSAIIQAFSGLIHQMLMLSDNALSSRRSAILNAVGQYGRLIIDVIPELELIIGKQPEPEKISALEERRRFNGVFVKFVSSIVDPQQPLIIFVDDLHWADSASLSLMEAVLLDRSVNNLLLIGCYRDMEVKDNPALVEFLDQLRNKKPDAKFAALKPVDSEYVEMLIEDLLHIDRDEARTFITLIVEKTNCNPLFIKEFLLSLYAEGVIRFQHSFQKTDADRWHIDMAGALNAELPDSVVALLTQRIQKLPEAVQKCLNIAACIGTQFQTDLLAFVNEMPPADVCKCLNQLCGQGFLSHIDDEFKFIHDRIREAACEITDPNQRQNIHYAIGKALISGKFGPRSDDVCMVASQLNMAHNLLSETERDQLIRLNLRAGKKAKRLTAYPAALAYFDAGLTLLSKDAWKIHYDVALAMHTEAAETAYICADIGRAEHLVDLILRNARTLLDKVKGYEIRMSCLLSLNKLAEALQEGIHILNRLGVKLPRNPGKMRILWELVTVRYALSKKTFDELKNIGDTHDPIILTRHRIMTHISSFVLGIQPSIFPFIALNGLKSSLTRGYMPDTAVYFAFYSLFLGARGKIDTGYRYGQLALSLIERPDAKPRSKAEVFARVNGGAMCWKHHIRDTLPPILDTYTISAESGYPELAARAALIYCGYSFIAGLPLKDVLRRTTAYLDIVQQNKQKTFANALQALQWFISNISGASGPRPYPDNCVNDELAGGVVPISSDDKMRLCTIYVTKTTYHFFKGNYSNVVTYSNLAFEYMKVDPSLIYQSLLYWYNSLARLALIRNYAASGKTGERQTTRHFKTAFFKERQLKRVAANQRQLKKWSRHAPSNFLGKWTLVEAERASVCGKQRLAVSYYHQAIALSQKHALLHEEALSNEMLARHYRVYSDDDGFKRHLRRAIDSYDAWGCGIKQWQLSSEYHIVSEPKAEEADVVGIAAVSPIDAGKTDSASVSLNPAEMDLQLVADNLDSILNRCDVKEYLQRLSETIMQYTGAQRVLLLTKRDTLSIGVDNDIGNIVNVLVPLQSVKSIPHGIIQYVIRSHETLLLDDALKTPLFANDPYIRNRQGMSVLCMPLFFQNKLSAVLYLENNLHRGIFKRPHLKMLTVLCNQTALFLENEALKSHPVENYSPIPSDILTSMLHDQYGLTPQEAKIAVMFKDGHTRRDVCETLNIADRTLKKHLQMIYDKTVNFEDNFSNQGRMDKLSRLIVFLFKLCDPVAPKR